MMISDMRLSESNGADEAGQVLTEAELDAVTGGCVLVKPGPKGDPVPEVSN